MSSRRIDLNKNFFLFGCTATASEFAQMLHGSWDGCNGVFLEKPDEAAIETATGLLKAEYCRQGDCCLISDVKQTFMIFGKTRSGKSVLAEEYILQALSEELSVMSSFNSPKTEALSDHIEARELDPQLHYHHCLDINLLQNRSQEQEP